MKLLECYITGFGAFEDYKISFDEGLNVIMQPNGWGKTTLAAFIKAMFYGFDRKRVRNVSENERLRYLPWNAKKYGGTLDFEKDGVAYRIIRSFGKVSSGDKVSVINIDTGDAVREALPNPGPWLFGLDAAAFQKTVFVGQATSGVDGSVEGLRSRLNALVNEADDVSGMDKYLKNLDERRKYYQRTGNRGRISEIAQEMDSLLEKRSRMEGRAREVEQLGNEIDALDASIDELAQHMLKLQQQGAASQNAERDLHALMEVRNQLTSKKEAAEKRLHEFDAATGTQLSDDDIARARKSLAALADAQTEARVAQGKVDQCKTEREKLALRYDGTMPTAEEIDQKQQALSELMRQKKALDAKRPQQNAAIARIDGALEKDASLLDRAKAARHSLDSYEANKSELEGLQREVGNKNARWVERGAILRQLREEDVEAASHVPNDATERIQDLRATAEELGTIAKELSSLETKKEVAASRLAEAQADAAKEQLPVTADADLDELRERVGTYLSKDAACAEMRMLAEKEESSLSDLRAELDNAQVREREANDSCSKLELSRAEAVGEEATARAALEEARQAQRKKSPLPMVFIGLGVLAVIAGVVLGAISPISIAAYVVGAACIAMGAAQLKRGSDNSQDLGPLESQLSLASSKLAKLSNDVDEAKRNREHAREKSARAQEAYDEQSQVAARAREAVQNAEHEKSKLEIELSDVFESYGVYGTVSPSSVKVHLDSLDERNKGAVRREQLVVERSSQMNDIEERMNELKDRGEHAVAHAGLSLDAEHDFMRGSEEARRLANDLEAYQRQAQSAHARLVAAVADYQGVEVQEIGDGALKKTLLALDAPQAPGVEELLARIAQKSGQNEQYEKQLNSLLAVFGIRNAGTVSADVERLDAAIQAYEHDKAAEVSAVREYGQKEQRVLQLATSLDAWAKGLGLLGYEDLTEQTFRSLREDLKTDQRLAWEEQRERQRVLSAKEKSEVLRSQLGSIAPQLADGDANAGNKFLSEAEDASRRRELTRAQSMAAAKELEAWQIDNGKTVSELQAILQTNDSRSARSSLDELQRNRESLLRQKSQLDERRDAILAELEDYPSVVQQIKLLSDAKQRATANLFTIRQTSAYLEKARRSLDGRYLGGLTDRFNDYTNAWLADEDFEVAIDPEFKTSVMGDGQTHDAASYSTGYQDVLDMCFRMALVDTVFESEQPFIVLDDPFVSLDQEKVGRALLMIKKISGSRQLIYFTCHPSRLDTQATSGHVEFTLPEQRASRELPRDRKRREAEERAKAQAELVASYHVVPVVQGRAGLMVEGSRHVITSNLLNVRFTVDPATGHRDNSFEVHFIDQKGRALCERQTVAIINERAVPDKVRFAMTTHEDSGSEYDLVIHEEGKEPAELAARIPFRVEIAFSTEDFDF